VIPTPRVSVIIPTYNRAGYLPLAVRSVLAQTFRDLEVLIMDDASTDQSPDIVRDLMDDRRVTYVKHPINVGINMNRNSGLARARGEYVAMLDSDDLWLDPDKLRRQVEVMDSDRRCALVGTFAKVLDPDGKEIGELTPYVEHERICRALLVRNQFVHSSVLLRKRMLDRAGWYDTSIPIWEDYELWLRVGAVGTVCNLPAPLTGYRRHSGNISLAAEEKSIVSYWYIYRRHRKAYPFGYLMWLKAMLLTCRYHLKHPLTGRKGTRAA
jgi:glycosyltransferase involved in cell wall biosynthesis